MKQRSKLWLRILLYSITILAGLAASEWIGRSALGRWAELRTYDLRFKLRGPLPPSPAAPLVILAIDDEAFSHIPLPLMFWHGVFARLVSRLAANQAALIAIDFIFADISKFDPEGQKAFSQVLLQAGESGVPVILAYQVRTSGVEHSADAVRLAALAAGHTFAFVNLTTDSDDFVRRQQLFGSGEGNQIEPGFALAIANAYASKVRKPFSPPDSTDHMMLINYRGPGHFSRISLARAVEAADRGDESFFQRHFQGRMVLIGRVGGPGDEDLHSTPQYFWEDASSSAGTIRTPGVEIHANAITTLLEQSYLKQLAPGRQRVVVLIVSLLVALLCLRFSPTLAPVLSSLVIVGYISVACLVFFPRGWWFPIVSPAAGALLTLGAVEIIDFIVEGREKRQLRELFKRYVNDQVIERILQTPEALALRGERKRVTILFADIRDYTSRSEAAPAEAVVGELNCFFTAMVKVIQEHNGMVDKFIGDAIMAIFGAPVEDADAAFHGVQAALAMSAALRQLNRENARRGAEPISIGIGIHTGEAVIGNIGSAQKMEYTAIGDAVNVASRIQGLTRNFDTEILISGETFKALGGRIPATPLGEEHLKGRLQRVALYAVAAPNPDA